jgi:hypothetical protein
MHERASSLFLQSFIAMERIETPPKVESYLSRCRCR